MNKIVSILLTLALSFGSGGCSDKEKSENKENGSLPESQAQSETQENSSVLIAYFSRAGENYGVGTVEKGNTRILAEVIESSLDNADMFEIASVNPYPDNYDEATEIARQEQKENARPELTGSVENFDKYDTVFIGYPIWYSDMPMPVYTFLESYDFTGKTVVPFCTHAGSGLASTAQTLENILDGATVLPGLAVKGVDAQNNKQQVDKTVKAWLNEMNFN